MDQELEFFNSFIKLCFQIYYRCIKLSLCIADNLLKIFLESCIGILCSLLYCRNAFIESLYSLCKSLCIYCITLCNESLKLFNRCVELYLYCIDCCIEINLCIFDFLCESFIGIFSCLLCCCNCTIKSCYCISKFLSIRCITGCNESLKIFNCCVQLYLYRINCQLKVILCACKFAFEFNLESFISRLSCLLRCRYFTIEGFDCTSKFLSICCFALCNKSLKLFNCCIKLNLQCIYSCLKCCLCALNSCFKLLVVNVCTIAESIDQRLNVFDRSYKLCNISCVA